MKKLKNGWLHKNNYIKSLVVTSIILLIAIAFCVYSSLVLEAGSMTILLYAILGFLVGSIAYMYFYSKDIRELSNEVNKVYYSMDPNSFYEFVNSLDVNILHPETVAKLEFFTIWFKHFEGKDDEAREMFKKYDVNPFPYPNMLSLKVLIQIYLLENKEEGYPLINEATSNIQALNIKPRLKQQLLQEVEALRIRVDALSGKEVDERLIEALKQPMSPFEYVQNQTLLAFLVKDSDYKTCTEAINYVRENYGQFKSFKTEVDDIVVTAEPKLVEENELIENENQTSEETLNLVQEDSENKEEK